MFRQFSNRSGKSDTSSTSMDDSMDTDILENTMVLHKPAYIARDTVTGTINVRSSRPLELLCLNIKLLGEGMTLYFNTNYRAQRLCEITIPSISVKEHCTEAGRTWSVPFSLVLTPGLVSSIDSEKKGRVRYYMSWQLKGNVGELTKRYQEITILAYHSLDALPRNREMTGNNVDQEEYDKMKLQLYSPASAYLPGEQIQFRAYVQNLGNKPLKKIAVLLIQNVLFYKSACNEDTKGRTRSFLMSCKEKSLKLKQDDDVEWTDEIQIPDPVPPSVAVGFHQINYELVLVAITKGNKSSIQAVFEKARYHFDLEKYQDDYFRDFLPHAHCDFQVGSHHGNKRSAYMSSGQQPIQAMNDIWKQERGQTSQGRSMPRTRSQPMMARITFNPPVH